MALDKSFVFLCLFSVVYCKDCVIDHRTEDFSWEVQLYNDVIKKCIMKSNLFKPPPNNSTNPLNVTLNFIVRNFRFLSNEEVFSIYNMVYIQWVDERLTWDPKKYGGIEKMIVSSMRIWTPGLRLFNTLDENEIDFLYCKCFLEYDGKVQCIPRMRHDAACSSKLGKWPYDTQSCTLHFGNWEKPYTSVVFTFAGISMFGAEYGVGWNIINYNVSQNPNKTEQISITFDIERQAPGLVVTIVMPCFVLCVLTLTSLVLKVDGIRLSMSGLCLLLHYYILQQIAEFIPKHSADPPMILLLVRSSAVLTFITIPLTCFLQYLMNTDKPLPAWITKVNDCVLKTKFKFIIWPRWEDDSQSITLSENLTEGKKIKGEWLDFANVLNSLFIVVFTVVYACFFSVYMSKLTPITFTY
ncbi:neuronal acetylcholine receptor subunit beta-2-like [Pectinophora gossypiella]|uniref:neuronal acetylcholine receptor subunit beta-2-like n=1 Tax=Pectinophora gossypiella TaxID=13191 RepID=UPI00214EC8A1|nr:neuronal acetylcholine receptor subunit beta-2-like [Pectinophora gossypiella]